MGKSVNIVVNGRHFEVEVLGHAESSIRFSIAGREYEVRREEAVEETVAEPLSEATSSPVQNLQNVSPASRLHSKKKSQGNYILAPMPGVLKAILVKAGAKIKKGDVLMRIEAMKMENNIYAHSDGRVGKVHVAVGQEVRDQELLLELIS